MHKIYLLSVFVLLSIVTYSQTLIAGWDFQTTSNGGTATAVASNTPTSYIANVGTGNMYLDGTNGSSSWSQANELDAFGGTTVNTGGSTGFSTDISGASSLALLGGTSTSANGKFIVFKFSMTGLKDLVVSYATRGTSAGFSTQTWEYSLNGTTWTAGTTVSSINTSFQLKTLNTITGLDNMSTVYLRLTVTGATNGTGNNRLDNIQLNATTIILPVTLTSFTGTKAINGNVLNWKVANEVNFSQYVIERSTDQPNSFKSIGTTTATNAGAYQFNDPQAVGYNYYKLKLIDRDGKSTYSKIILIINQAKGFEVTNVYPTITSGSISLESFAAAPTKTTFKIVNQSGQIVFTQTALLTQSATTNLNLSQLSKGNYILQIATDSYNKTVKLIKQ